MVYTEFSMQNQDHNWSGDSPASVQDNPDRQIQTYFTMMGLQYMFDRDWGFQLELPYDHRIFETTSAAPGNPITSIHWSAWGDARLEGIYTGFSPDLSSGITFGLKLPTGDFTYNNAWGDVDRDSELGTGSTDVLLGGFHRGSLSQNLPWKWFAQGILDLPVLIQDQYRPGPEFDGVVGVDYEGWSIGQARISPIAQLIGSLRGVDSGAEAAQPVASGYERLLASPGIEVDLHPLKFYADVELPFFQDFHGNQLAATSLYKMSVSFMF